MDDIKEELKELTENFATYLMIYGQTEYGIDISYLYDELMRFSDKDSLEDLNYIKYRLEDIIFSITLTNKIHKGNEMLQQEYENYH